MKGFKRRFGLLLASLMLGLGLILIPSAGAISIGGPSDCDDNAIIKCGAHSTSALMQAYNSSAYVQKVYAYFGISAADMASLPSTNVAGRVMKDGRIFVDGQSQAVATGAVTGGRQNIAGSTQVNSQGVIFFKRPPNVSFQQNSLPAFVSMKNGIFQFAIIASCGNAVRATPVTPSKPSPPSVAPAKPVSRPPQKPKPQQPVKPQPQKPQAAQPQPTQMQTQQQQQTVNQSVTQNQQVTVNNTSNSQSEQTPAEAPAVPSSSATSTTSAPETVAAAPAEQSAAPSSDTTPAASLPNVGGSTGGTIGVFVGSTVLGILGYRRYLLHILGG
jgi:outer membrane biosynthesis protein TonB